MGSPALKIVPSSSPEPQPVAQDEARSILSDEELMALTCGGERNAFRILVERYETRAFHIARGILRRGEVAREVVQDAFLKVYAHRDTFDGKRKFGTWFFRILRNQSVDRLRRLKPGTPHGAGELVGDWGTDQPGPAASASARERRALVGRILEALPQGFREVLSMRDLEGMSCGEIAEVVETTPGTVRWRLHHARKLFRQHWERQFGPEQGDSAL